MPTFSLDHTPRPVTLPLQHVIDAPLPHTQKGRTRGFGTTLKPRYIVRAESLDQ